MLAPIDTQLEVATPIVEVTVAKLFRNFCQADQEDAQQEILVALWQRKLAAYNPARGPLRNFLWKVIRRLAIDQLAKVQNRKQPRAIKEDDHAGQDHHRTDRLAIRITAAPEAVLPPTKADQLKDFQRAESIDALASQWGCSKECAYQRLHRLRQSVAEIAA